MPLSRSSTWVAVAVAALTVVGSATSAFADRNRYEHHHFYHHHRMSPFGRHMMHRPMMHHHMHHHM